MRGSARRRSWVETGEDGRVPQWGVTGKSCGAALPGVPGGYGGPPLEGLVAGLVDGGIADGKSAGSTGRPSEPINISRGERACI
jgi:hypothetical protein